MQGVLYFPMINVPQSAWLVRALLYWDSVGAIIPEPYLHDPGRLEDSTRELLLSELLVNAFPASAHGGFPSAFEHYLDRIGDVEIRRRRQQFMEGKTVLLHVDKLLEPVLPRHLFDLGIADRPSHEWIGVEQQTAREWMAALVLGLCHPQSMWTHHFRGERSIDRWVPATDKPLSLAALLAGFGSSEPSDRPGRQMRLRVNGESRVAELRTTILEDVLPIPDGSIDIDKIIRFRRKHAELLPQLRRYLEGKLEEALLAPDDEIQMRRVDRIVDEARERVEQARAYLEEAGFRRVRKSSLVQILKFVPLFGGSVGVGQQLAKMQEKHSEFESEPLAYLAFASERFASRPRYGPSAIGQVSLVEMIDEGTPGRGYWTYEDEMEAEAAADEEMDIEDC